MTASTPTDPLFEAEVLEDSRLEALRRYDILDTPPEEAFDRLTDLAAELFDVDIAFVAFLDAERQWFKSTVGLDKKETALAGSFCTHTVRGGNLVVIQDAAGDERVADSPFVTEAGLHFYAGMPITTPDGHAIGTFSIMDPELRSFSEEDAERLRSLGQIATDELEHRRTARHHDQMGRYFDAVLEDPNMLAGVLSPEGRLLEANETALEYVAEGGEEVLGQLFWETPWWTEDMREEIRKGVEQAAGGQYVDYEADLTGPEGAPYSVEGTIRPVRNGEEEITALIVSARDVTERKDREEELRLYREVVEQANDAIVVTEADPIDEPGPRIEYVNRAFEEMTGYQREDVIGETPRILQGPRTEREVLDSLREAVGAEQEWEGETVNYGKDERPYRVHWSLAPVRKESGEVEHWVSVQRDVTEKREREQKLRLLGRALEQVGDKVTITDREGHIQYVNDAFETITGYEEEDVLGETPRILRSGEQEEPFYEDLWDTILSGETFRAEFTNQKKSGERYVEDEQISPVTSEEGEISHFVSVGRDVTEERQREKTLQRQKNLLEQTQRLTGAWEVDLRTQEASWSEKVYEIHEVLPGTEIDIETAIDFYAPEARPKLREAFERCVQDEEPYDLVLPIITTQGNRRWVRTVGAPSERENGEVVKVAGAFQDVTDRKEAETDLRETQRFYEQILKHVPIDLAVFTPDAVFEYLNPQSVTDPEVREWLIGHTNEEYCQKRGLDPAIGRRRDEAIREAAEDRTVTEIEETLQTENGPLEYLRVHGPVTNLEDEVTHVAAFGLDITEQKQRHRALERYRQYTDEILNSIDDVFYILDREGDLERWNQSLPMVTGYSGEEITEMHASDFFAGEHADDIVAAIEEVFETGEVRVEAPFHTNDGTEIPYEFTASLVEDPDGNEKLVGIGRDIAERKQREQKTEALYTATERLLQAQNPQEVAVQIEEVIRETFDYPLSGVHYERDGDLVPEQVSPGIRERWPEMPARDVKGDSLGARAYRTGETITAANLAEFDTTVDYLDLGSGACIPIGDHGVISLGSTETDGIDSFDVRLLEILAADAAAVLDRIEHEAELERQNKLFEKAQQIAQIGAWEYDVQSGDSDVTAEVCRIHGLSPESEMSPEESIEFYHPEDRATLRDAFDRAVQEGTPYDLELRLLTEDGEQRWVRTNGEPQVEEGNVGQVRGTIQDITKRKQRQQRLEVTTQRLDAILEHTTRPMFLKDREGRHLLVNQSFRSLFGLEDGEAVGRTNEDLFPPEDTRAVRENDRRVLETGTPLDVEERMEVDGDERVFLSSKVPLYDIGTESDPESPVAVFGVATDITERKQQERELRRKERRYRAVFEDPNILVGLLETDGRVLDVNRTALEYVTPSLADVEGEFFWDTPWFAGDQALQEEVQDWIQRAAAGEYVEFEADLSRAVGHPLVISGVVRPVTGEEGTVTSLLVTDRDVTEQKRHRRQLELYREYTDRLLNSSEDLLCVCDEDGTLRRWNDRLAVVSGYSNEELSSASVIDLIPEEDRSETQAAFETVFETGRAQVETTVRTQDGSTIPYEFTGNLVDHPDGEQRLVAIGRDVTARKQREDRLRERRRKVESLYEATRRLLTAESLEVVSKRIHDVITGVFDYALSNTGFVEGDMIVPLDVTTTASFDVLDPGPQPRDGGSVSARTLRAKETVVVEDVQALDNTIDYGALQSVAAVPIGERGVIVVGQVGERQFEPFDLSLLEVLGAYTSMVLDRLDRVQALRQAKQEAEEASRLKSAMLANMSHEIRTPLTSIIGFAELLEGELEGDHGMYINRIRDGGERLMRTLDSVLQLSRLEAGVYELEREAVSLRRVVEETADMLRLSAEEKMITLRTDLSEDFLRGTWNEGALDRILENLVENAIKFTPEGGTVEIRAWAEADEAVLEVEDTGVGISEEALPHVFTAFKQESEGLDREYEGSGLGLSIVKRLAAVHGGSVSVESEKGEGTCFTVRMPFEWDVG